MGLQCHQNVRHGVDASMKALTRCCVFLVMMSPFPLVAQRKSWPVVEPLHEKQTFNDVAKNDADTPFLVFLKDSKGISVYELECHNGNYEDASEINFSGAFQCVLFAVHGDRRMSGNLLAVDNKDERSTDWFNRGRILSDQLRGACAGYPEYESVRHFKLRGMLITFQLIDLEWANIDDPNKPELNKFTFDVSILPDKRAQTAAAEPVKGAKPPRSCY
jgi:hypothetical protein